MGQRTAIIIGAGPAGLTAAWELLERTDVRPIVFEQDDDVGGLSRTIEYAGNRIDIGGHRFFSRSDRVMDWWQDVLPLQAGLGDGDGEVAVTYHNKTRTVHAEGGGADPVRDERVMLVRPRISRIFFQRKFFDYPVSLSVGTLANLGLLQTIRIGLSYLRIRLRPRREERSLEDFFVNRFGEELYRTFFKDYTEKVWGVPCDQIRPEWGSQRVKGLSVTKALLHAVRSRFRRDDSIAQKESETSLIERFLYPKYGPGQMWREVARRVVERGGEIRMRRSAVALRTEGTRAVGVDFRNLDTGEIERLDGDFVFSTMPVKDLVRGMTDVPEPVRRVADGLVYRDFITVGLLLRKLKVRGDSRPDAPPGLIPDNWIYVQERDVRIGRLQIFNNWSPYLVRDPDTVWLGLEYFCNEGDDLWTMSDEAFRAFAAEELARIDVIDTADVLDGVVIRVPKTYPAYFGSYDEFDIVREWIDRFPNLFLVGRNGMHRYNNQDHSMLTAMVAVENIRDGVADKANIWAVNTEEDYHEEK